MTRKWIPGWPPPKLTRMSDVGRPLTAREKLANIHYMQTHCFTCDAEVPWDAEVCEDCGTEIAEHGKQ